MCAACKTNAFTSFGWWGICGPRGMPSIFTSYAFFYLRCHVGSVQAKGIATISEAQVFHDGQDNNEYLIYAGAFLILAKDENRYHRRRIAWTWEVIFRWGLSAHIFTSAQPFYRILLYLRGISNIAFFHHQSPFGINGPESPMIMGHGNTGSVTSNCGSVSSRAGSISGASGRRHKHSPDLQLNIEVTKNQKKHARQRISESSESYTQAILVRFLIDPMIDWLIDW